MGALKRLPVHPLVSKLRSLGTLAVLIAILGTIVTTAQANATSTRDDERTPNILEDSSETVAVDRDIDKIGQNSAISYLDIREDENDTPMEGEPEGRALKVVTLITKASNVDNATDVKRNEAETIEI